VIATPACTSNFLAAQVAAFTASLCYAKITPAALQRGDFEGRCRNGAEVTGGKPESGLSDLRRGIASSAISVVRSPSMAPS
jgi:hypothetical protein